MFKIVLYLIVITICNCNEDNSDENNKILASFRQQVEEITFENPLLSNTDEATNNLVSFLVNNAKKIFGESEEMTLRLEPTTDSDVTTSAVRKSILSYSTNKINDKLRVVINENELGFDVRTDEKDIGFGVVINEKILHENVSQSTKVNNIRFTFITNSTIKPFETVRGQTEKVKVLNLSKDLITLQKTEQIEREHQAIESIDPLVFHKSVPEKEPNSTRRSCIFCNNLDVMECYDPKNKLIPSSICEREEDLCYSLHTPFGIVDRGCFNVNHNLTTHVCSCNLCNFISISEMPHIFSTKRDWVENVIELSRTRRLRKSVLKEMTCLTCEVNTTTKTGNMLDSANCLEGNVAKLSIQECSENEICGVKAIRSEGYIWRGCVSKPLYNYWWTLCDSDLCNYDSLVSIYDEL